jgi:hypothetical protein
MSYPPGGSRGRIMNDCNLEHPFALIKEQSGSGTSKYGSEQSIIITVADGKATPQISMYRIKSCPHPSTASPA